jgi:hypothetical protein
MEVNASLANANIKAQAESPVRPGHDFHNSRIGECRFAQ